MIRPSFLLIGRNYYVILRLYRYLDWVIFNAPLFCFIPSVNGLRHMFLLDYVYMGT